MSKEDKKLKYLKGFGNHFVSEVLEGAVPESQNNPLKCPYGLIAEQLSGTAFTKPRSTNLRSWLYRINPTAKHGKFKDYKKNGWIGTFQTDEYTTPDQLRWFEGDIPTKEKVDFIDGTFTVCGSGSPNSKEGIAVHQYFINTSMNKRVMVNADGDLLFVPQTGELTIVTEFGIMKVKPREICVIQRGIKFQINCESGCRGYISEIFNSHFVIPDLGPIGANGLANPKDFETPTAWYEDKEENYELIHKFCGKLFSASLNHSPFDVVGWHGNYAPFKYDLDKFNTMNTVSYDHPDPSIFTVLTCQSNDQGTAVLDFVIFPPRWMVAEKTFRPPYYHRNVMCEYMGLISGVYDAKGGKNEGKKGFVPGGSSLHNVMTGHGPETKVYENYINKDENDLVPEKYSYDNLAFMFESCFFMNPTEFSMKKLPLDEDYKEHSWNNFKKTFDISKK
eukprot:gene11109-3816_t